MNSRFLQVHQTAEGPPPEQPVQGQAARPEEQNNLGDLGNVDETVKRLCGFLVTGSCVSRIDEEYMKR